MAMVPMLHRFEGRGTLGRARAEDRPRITRIDANSRTEHSFS